MKPDTIFYFSRVNQSRYVQTGCKGKPIPDFLSVYKGGKYRGEKYIISRRASHFFKQSNQEFSHTLELAKGQIVARFIFMTEYPCQSYGTYKDYALLIEFSKDFDKLAVWFFKGQQEAAPILFQKRQAGEIPEIVKTEVVRLKYRAGLSEL